MVWSRGYVPNLHDPYNWQKEKVWMDDEFEDMKDQDEVRERKKREIERSRARDKARKAFEDYANKKDVQ